MIASKPIWKTIIVFIILASDRMLVVLFFIRHKVDKFCTEDQRTIKTIKGRSNYTEGDGRPDRYKRSQTVHPCRQHPNKSIDT